MEYKNFFALLGGLALFLYGMHQMSEGLNAAAGEKMKQILERLTKNRFLGVGVGAAVTAVIQSSSATTVMVVGFVNSGMMTLRQAVWIIMGANIGTTITAWIVSMSQLGDAFEGAETALFDEISSTLRYAAFRLLCVWGATSVERSREAWPILDEAIQCYHGDLEYRDMLGCLYEFGQGEIDAEVAEKLALRLKFDAENGKGSYLKARSSEICEMLVKRFGLDLSKKKKRASVKKSDDAEDEE